MAGEGHAREMNDLERELRALVPRGPHVDVARLMYEAGQASLSPVPPTAPSVRAAAARSHWLWPLSTALTASLAAWLGITLVILQNRTPLATPEAPSAAPAAPATIANHQVSPPGSISPAPRPEVSPPMSGARDQAQTWAATDRGPGITSEGARYLRAREVAIDQGVEAIPSLAADNASAAPASPTAQSTAAQQAVHDELRSRTLIRGGAPWKFWWGN